jgi:hypothetical protein
MHDIEKNRSFMIYEKIMTLWFLFFYIHLVEECK